MSDSATNRAAALAAADGLPATVGRGSGFTLREMNRKINAYMRRKHIPSHKWRTKAECDAERARLRPAIAPLLPPRRHACCRVGQLGDLWDQL